MRLCFRPPLPTATLTALLMPLLAALGGVVLPFISAAPAQAQSVAQDRCLALAERRNPLLHRVNIPQGGLEPYQARVTFLGHATFLIESPKGIKLATDYAAPIFEPNLPDIVTMNMAHETHYTDTPQKEITHVLRGWNPDGDGPAIHDLTVEDFRVRNVPTNIRSWSGDTHEFGNSIFIFEIGPLCIAHLGHLHHPLTNQQLANIGQMDVVLVPVDGSWTLDYPGTIEVLGKMNPRVIIPMHYFTSFTLERFLTATGGEYPVKTFDTPTTVISKDQLPGKPEIWVLPGN